MPVKTMIDDDEELLLARYCRISMAHDPVGTKRQLRGMDRDLPDHRLLRHKPWRIVGDYVDNSISAFDLSKVREDYERLRNDLMAGVVNAVAVFEFDRLYRQPLELEQLLDLMEKVGARYIIVNDGQFIDLETGEGLDILRIKGTLSASEIRKIKKRIREWHRDRALLGLHSGGARRFGYDAQMKSVIEAEERLIVQAAEEILALKETPTSIAKRWQEAGIATPGGTRFHTAILKKELNNPPSSSDPAYLTLARHLIGEEGYNPSQCVMALNSRDDMQPPPTFWKSTTVKRVLTGQHISGFRTYKGQVIKAMWPAILPEEQRVALETLLNDPSRRTNHGQTVSKYPLSGLIRCGRQGCGTVMTTRYQNGKRTWGCEAVRGGCGKNTRVFDPLENWIYQQVLAYADNPMTRDRLIAYHQGATDNPLDVSDLTQQLDQAQAALDELETDWYTKPKDQRPQEKIYLSVKGNHEATIRRVKKSLQENASKHRQPIDLSVILEGGLTARWPDLTLEQQREVIRFAVAYVEIKPVGRGFKIREASQSFEIHWAA